MNVSAEVTVGLFTAEVTVTDTGPDGLSSAVDRCRDLVREFVGAELCHSAALSTWVED